jgi:uncharacterized protein (TIGR02444 family)
MYSKYSVEAAIQRSLWNFSLNLYDNPLIDEAGSILQDRYQLNINMIFLCCWLAKENFRALTPEEFVSIIARVTPWNRRVVFGLVVLLRLMKRARNRSALSQVSPLLALEKKVIIDKRFADKIEQSLMLPVIRNLEKQEGEVDPNRVNAALTNVFGYINTQKISIHQNDLEKVYRIVKACFSE